MLFNRKQVFNIIFSVTLLHKHFVLMQIFLESLVIICYFNAIKMGETSWLCTARMWMVQVLLPSLPYRLWIQMMSPVQDDGKCRPVFTCGFRTGNKTLWHPIPTILVKASNERQDQVALRETEVPESWSPNIKVKCFHFGCMDYKYFWGNTIGGWI